MIRAVLTTALIAGAMAKGVALGVALTTAGAAGAACVRCACRSRPRKAEPAPLAAPAVER
jgi:hypothetical protein